MFHLFVMTMMMIRNTHAVLYCDGDNCLQLFAAIGKNKLTLHDETLTEHKVCVGKW